MEVREAEGTATNLTVGREREKESSQGFAAAITGYSNAGIRHRRPLPVA